LLLAHVAHHALHGVDCLWLYRIDNVLDRLQASDNVDEGDLFLLGPPPRHGGGSNTHGGQPTKVSGYQVVTGWGLHGVGGYKAVKVVLKRGIRPGAWTSSARQSRLNAAPARHVITQITRLKPKLTHGTTSPLCCLYTTAQGTHKSHLINC
jgi:hypothetical protein